MLNIGVKSLKTKISKLKLLFLLAFIPLIFPPQIVAYGYTQTVLHQTNPYFAGFQSNIPLMSKVSLLKASWVVPNETCQSPALNEFYIDVSSAYVSANIGIVAQCTPPAIKGLPYIISYNVIYEFSNWCTQPNGGCSDDRFVTSWSPRAGDSMLFSIQRLNKTVIVSANDLTEKQTVSLDCSKPPPGTYFFNPCSSLWQGNGVLVVGLSLLYLCTSVNCFPQPVANFKVIHFHGVYARIGGSLKPIATASSSLTEYTMVSMNNAKTIIAATSPLSTGGTSFSVTWKNEGP